MTQYTEGPWKALVDKGGDNLSVTALDGDVTVIGGCGCCGSPWTDEDCAEANARLIAAAPDLLRALEDILPGAGWANYSDEELLDEAAKGNETAPRILNARAAIAKARNT